MGLAASQVRMLSLTSRRASIERDMLRDSNRKIALSREMNNLANEYYDALSAERLMYLSDTGEYRNLSYQYLMGKPGGIEDIEVKSDYSLLLLDTLSGKVVLNDKMADKIQFSQSELASDSQNIYLAIARLCGDRNIVKPDGCTDDLIISPNLVKDICAGKYDNFDIEDLTNAINNTNYCIYSPEVNTVTTYMPVATQVDAVDMMNNVAMDSDGLSRVNYWINTGEHYAGSLDPEDMPDDIPEGAFDNTSAYDPDNTDMSNLYTISGAYSDATLVTNYSDLSGEEAQAAASAAYDTEHANIENRIKNLARGMATEYFGADSYNDLSLQQKMAVAMVLKSFSIGEIQAADNTEASTSTGGSTIDGLEVVDYDEPGAEIGLNNGDVRDDVITGDGEDDDGDLSSNLYERTNYATIVDTSDGNASEPAAYEIKFDTTLFLNALQMAYNNTQEGGEFELENYSGAKQTVKEHYHQMYANKSGTAYAFGDMANVDFTFNTGSGMVGYGEYNHYEPIELTQANAANHSLEVKVDPTDSQYLQQGIDDFDFYTNGTTTLYSTIDNLYHLSDSGEGGNHLVQVNSGSLNDNYSTLLTKAIRNVLDPVAAELARSMPVDIDVEDTITSYHSFQVGNVAIIGKYLGNYQKFSDMLNDTTAEFREGSTGSPQVSGNLRRVISASDIEEDGTCLTDITNYLTDTNVTSNGRIIGDITKSNVNDILDSADGYGYTTAPALGYAVSGGGDDYHNSYDIQELHITSDAAILEGMELNIPGISNRTQSDDERLAVYTTADNNQNEYFFVDASALINDFYARVLGENIGYGYDTDGNYEYLAPTTLSTTINSYVFQEGEGIIPVSTTWTSSSGSSVAGYTPYVDGNDLAKILKIQSGNKQELFATRTVVVENTAVTTTGNFYVYNGHQLNFCPAGETEMQWIQNFKDLIRDVKFYYTIVTACAKFDYTTEYGTNLDDSEYLDKNIQNGVFQLMGFDTDVFSLNSAKDTDYYLLTSEFSKMNDPAQQAIITAWYESEKAEINAKETYLDTQIENLSVELNSIKTEIESVKTLIDDAVKQNFDWGKA